MPKDKHSDIIISSSQKAEWHVFYVKSRHEKMVYDRLTRDGFHCYLPVQKVRKQWSDRKKWVEEVLFKSYIFVKVPAHSLYDVLQNPDVITYIKFEGKPATVSEKTLFKIKELIENKTRIEAEAGIPNIGTLIKIKTGQFKGYKGKITEIRGKKKLVVMLEEFNFSLIIELEDL